MVNIIKEELPIEKSLRKKLGQIYKLVKIKPFLIYY